MKRGPQALTWSELQKYRYVMETTMWPKIGTDGGQWLSTYLACSCCSSIQEGW
ncbi:hypothetical protein DPMN_143091 [Dreissena polymorpha]|uniref:Uncharacterized protein n=1 Tax=Dreissena polymorpha TaxID=45954 RepID=A0A9D4GCY0_DREPO|nr:hypothetical protein DPMN_143091 [Dreissena polymorpha]